MMTRGGGRDVGMDVVRGLCIVSMVIAHVAGGSTLYALSHAGVWVDGAMGFVMLSGLVLGIVQRRMFDKSGSVRSGVPKILKRTKDIYLLHVALTILALVIATYVWTDGRIAPVELRDWPLRLIGAAALVVNPTLSILGMYVVFMLLTVPAVWLLARRRAWLLLLVSLFAYVVSALAGFDSSLPGQGDEQAFHLAAWQFLFFAALIIGWNWRSANIRRLVLAKPTVVVALVVSVVSAGLAHVTVRAGMVTGTAADVLNRVYEKLDLGPAAVLYAFATCIVLYAAATWAMTARWSVVLRPVQALGTKSLDSYVLSTACAMALPAFLRYSPGGIVSEVLAVLVCVICWTWSWFRLRPPRTAPAERDIAVPATQSD